MNAGLHFLKFRQPFACLYVNTINFACQEIFFFFFKKKYFFSAIMPNKLLFFSVIYPNEKCTFALFCFYLLDLVYTSIFLQNKKTGLLCPVIKLSFHCKVLFCYLFAFQEINQHRITSYNVCYTKLLRVTSNKIRLIKYILFMFTNSLIVY